MNRPSDFNYQDECLHSQGDCLPWTPIRKRFTPYLERNLYIRWSCKDVGSFYLASKDLMFPAIIFLNKSHIRGNLGYCCNIRPGTLHSSLAFLDRVQKCLRRLERAYLFSTLQPIPTDGTWHDSRYTILVSMNNVFYEQHSLVPQIQPFTPNSDHTLGMAINYIRRQVIWSGHLE